MVLTQRMNPYVNYGLQLIMCQYWLVSHNKCTTLMQDVIKRGLGVASTWELSVCPAQFFGKPKLAKKKKKKFIKLNKYLYFGAPGWHSGLSVQLWLRS